MIFAGLHGSETGRIRAGVALMAFLASVATCMARTHELHSDNLTLTLAETGEVIRVKSGETGVSRAVHCGTRLDGCRVEGDVQCEPGRWGRGMIEFRRKLVRDSDASTCTLVERWISYPTHISSSIRCEMEIEGEGAPWSTHIITTLRWPSPENALYWTAWSDPELRNDAWRDPLVMKPLTNVRFDYGGVTQQKAPYISVPLVTVADPREDSGLSLLLCPSDTMLSMSLSVAKDGTMEFVRANHRISSARPVKLRFDLAAHEADWRPALGCMHDLYSGSFWSHALLAEDVEGCGGYSSYEGDLDADKLHAMAFRTNWKASFDFPYMGMFLPPVANDTDKWPRFDSDTHGKLIPGKQTYTSLKQMRDYSTKMRGYGFHVLNYFNVTEFGAGIKLDAPTTGTVPAGESWRDANTFLREKIADGILYRPNGKPYGTWGGAVVMDPGAPNYQAFILEQAKRHLKELPDSSGICIDRLDWLRCYNPRADDGVSWVDGKPARSLLSSWKDFMSKLEPEFHAGADYTPASHRDDRLIFVNDIFRRIDPLEHVDGIYDEFGDKGPCLNASAVMCLAKPLIVWTRDEKDLRPDPDAFFQRHLHLGAFPTAPVPGNDHTITPSEWVDRQYLDYGPLLNVLRSRRWVLEPHVVQVVETRKKDDGNTTATAKLNLFKVRSGWAMPVTFGGDAKSVRVKLQGAGWKDIARRTEWLALHPGIKQTVELKPVMERDGVRVDVPLVRGCAMVTLVTKGERGVQSGPRAPR